MLKSKSQVLGLLVAVLSLISCVSQQTGGSSSDNSVSASSDNRSVGNPRLSGSFNATSDGVAGAFKNISVIGELAKGSRTRGEFESKVYAKMRSGEISGGKLSVDYDDGSTKVFRR